MYGAPQYAIPAAHYAHVTQVMQHTFVPSAEDAANALPLHGNTTTYNINALLHQNILESDYFRALYQLQTYHEVIDEVHASVTHVEPWQAGTSRHPSTAFCLLLKFMTLRLTRNQLVGLVETSDSALVRAIGFLYLRYAAPPAELFAWYEPYLESEEEFCPAADTTKRTTIGEYLIKLLTDMQYFNTTLPRIPVPIERKIKVMLLLLAEKKRRRRANEKHQSQGLFAKGVKVRAIYSDADNEPAWYEAVIDSKDEAGRNKFWVTFTEYGNSECVDLGDMELLEVPREKSDRNDDRRDRSGDRRDRSGDRRDRSRDRGDRRGRSGERRSRSRSRDRPRRERSRSREDDADLMEKVLRSSREASLAVGRNYGQRPASYKGSLSLKLDRHTVRQRSRSRSPVRRDRPPRSLQRSRSRSPVEKRAPAMTAEQQERMRKLKERYGDASGGN